MSTTIYSHRVVLRGDCFVCKRRPRVFGGYLGPHLDKAGHVCPGSGEVAS